MQTFPLSPVKLDEIQVKLSCKCMYVFVNTKMKALQHAKMYNAHSQNQDPIDTGCLFRLQQSESCHQEAIYRNVYSYPLGNPDYEGESLESSFLVETWTANPKALHNPVNRNTRSLVT